MKIPTFLKWAGGKRSIICDLNKYVPKKFNNYFEPFLGGGSVFFFIKQKYAPKRCMISDINKDLINTYVVVRDKPYLLIKHLNWFKKNNSKEFYYWVRTNFNNKGFRKIQRSAAFIYLNKTCFNGLYRVNKKNQFNVPYANYKNPGIFDIDTIYSASKLLQDVQIIHQDYRKILKFVSENDFVYLDPCYDPIKRTSFDKYTPKRFSPKERIELAKFVYQLRKNGSFVLLSNNDIPEIRKLYGKFEINEIAAHRFINSKGNGRGKVIELAISINRGDKT
jgi:DNA adenine methylase